MKIIHGMDIYSGDTYNDKLLRILKSGYLLPINSAIYFNIYNEKYYNNFLIGKVKFILRNDFLLNRDFYFCHGNNFLACLNKDYLFNIKSLCKIELKL